MSLVPNETQQALNAQREAFVASIEVFRQKINEQADRIAQLEAALREAALELDAYYRAEYPGDHPYSKKKLAEAMASNPARAALGGENDQ